MRRSNHLVQGNFHAVDGCTAFSNLHSDKPLRRKYWWLTFSDRPHYGISVWPKFGEILLERDGGRCRYCGIAFDARLDKPAFDPMTNLATIEIEIFLPAWPEVDHVIPRSKGGTDDLDNLVLACSECNNRKAGRTPEEAGMELRPELI